MTRTGSAAALRLDFGDAPAHGYRRGLRLAPYTGPSRAMRGPDKYRLLDLKRRRAQIRARRALDYF